MKGYVTFVLFILVITLGAFIWFFERDTWSTAEQNARSRKAFSIDPEEVNRIEIQRGAMRLICAKQEDRWMVLEPVNDPADDAMINRFLYYLDLLRKNSAITAQDREARNLTLSDYGMDVPQAVITLSGSAKTRNYLVGRMSTLDKRVYVKEESGDAIVSVDNHLLQMIPASPADWRVRSLFQENAGDITRFSIRRADGILQAGKLESGQWVIQQPIKARAAAASIQQLLDKLHTLQVGQFVADSVKDVTAYGLDHPAIELALWQKNSKNADTLLIGRPSETLTNTVFVKWNSKNSVCAVTNELIQLLSVPLNDLRARRLTSLTAQAVRQVLLTQGEQVIELTKKEDDRWYMLRPSQEKADDALVELMVENWCDAGILRYVADDITNRAAFGFQPPLFSITLATTAITTAAPESVGAADPNTWVELLASATPPENGELLVCGDGACVYAVPAQQADTVKMNPLYYRDRELLRIPRGQILRIDKTCGGVQDSVAFDADTQSFAATEPEGAGVDAAALEIFLRLIGRLSIERYVAENPEDLSAFGLNAPSAVIRIGLTGADGIGKTLLLGSETVGGNVYAMLQGRDVVFELNRVAAAMLCAPLTETTTVESAATTDDEAPN